MNKPRIFIIGIRRSGTSLLRSLILSHPKIAEIKFEPHELIYCCRTQHINRYKNSEYHKKIIAYYTQSINIYKGAKIAVNVGIEAMNWKWVNNKIPNSIFIFIKRNVIDNFKSWYELDKNSVRGVCNYKMYKSWYNLINKSFEDFRNINPKRTCLISYENLVKNADNEMLQVWNTLGLSKIQGLNRIIRKPNNWSINEKKKTQ